MSIYVRIRNGMKPVAGEGGVKEDDLMGFSADLLSGSGGVVDIANDSCLA